MKNIIFLITILLVGCNAAPSEEIIQTAIAQTQAAMPAPTDEPITIPTAVPTEIVIEEPTTIPTEAPAPTEEISNLVFDINPRNLLMEKNDIPFEGKYYIPGGDWKSPLTNIEVIANIGVELGKEYLASTERIDGWKIGFKRGSFTEISPEEIHNVINLHETRNGALEQMNEYGICLDQSKGYRIINTDFSIGDLSSVCMDTENHASGDRRVTLLAEFVYHNLFVSVEIWGWEDEITPEFLIEITENLFARLEEIELKDSVFFRP